MPVVKALLVWGANIGGVPSCGFLKELRRCAGYGLGSELEELPLWWTFLAILLFSSCNCDYDVAPLSFWRCQSYEWPQQCSPLCACRIRILSSRFSDLSLPFLQSFYCADISTNFVSGFTYLPLTLEYWYYAFPLLLAVFFDSSIAFCAPVFYPSTNSKSMFSWTLFQCPVWVLVRKLSWLLPSASSDLSPTLSPHVVPSFGWYHARISSTHSTTYRFGYMHRFIWLLRSVLCEATVSVFPVVFCASGTYRIWHSPSFFGAYRVCVCFVVSWDTLATSFSLLLCFLFVFIPYLL